MTVDELIAKLRELPGALTVVYSDSQHGDCAVRNVEDATCYCGTSARVVRIS